MYVASPGSLSLCVPEIGLKPGQPVWTRTSQLLDAEKQNCMKQFDLGGRGLLRQKEEGSDVEDMTIATLPYNHKFGPVFNVAIRNHYDAWQILVEAPSICNDVYGNSDLKVFVIISDGVTQWARWQGNTGDPRDGGFNPIPPEGDDSFARGDPGMVKVDGDIPEIYHTRKGSETWQAPC